MATEGKYFFVVTVHLDAHKLTLIVSLTVPVGIFQEVPHYTLM